MARTDVNPMVRRRTSVAANIRSATMGNIAMTPAFHHIRHADGRAYYEGRPLSLADAHLMLNDDILRRAVRPGAYLRVERSELILESGSATQ
jgi:hypothetical protein